MNKSILITGVAGSGKSAVCNEWKRLGYKAYGIEDMDGLFTMVDKKTGKIVGDHDNDNLDDLLPLFDKIFLLKVSPKILRKRLSTRTSKDFGRTSEVQKWILSWKKWWEDHICEKGAIIIDANRSLQEIATDIIKRSKSSK